MKERTRVRETWLLLLEKQIASLRNASTQPSSEVKIILVNLVDLCVLGWSFLKESRSRTMVEDHPKMKDDERGPWWSKKSRYAKFDGYAKEMIRRAVLGRKGENLSKTASSSVYLSAFARLIDRKILWKNMKAPRKIEERFAASVLFAIDPKKTLSEVEKEKGGLSFLLADLEHMLGLITDTIRPRH